MSIKIQPTVFLFLCVPLAALLLLPASLHANPPGSLADRVSTLEQEVAELKALLAGVSRQEVYDGVGIYYDTLVLSGMNVQIDNGTGDILTPGGSTPNGLGNLIIGYNTFRFECDGRLGCQLLGNLRSGSHMLVVGDANNYQGYGGIIAGEWNYTSGPYASIIGGRSNYATGSYATVSGGSSNRATGDRSSVSGGLINWASGVNSSVSGGYSNIANGKSEVVVGGDYVYCNDGSDSEEESKVCGEGYIDGADY